MKILGMGMPELLIILAVVLLIFGPKNLPKLGASLGKTVKGLREGLGGTKDEVAEEVVLVEEDEEEEEPARPVSRTVKATKKKAPATETV
ncbi:MULTISPECIES: twin-arginine translocase TatA/TatE family subunit [Gordonibacter]|uniref:Sec-independent protein translocase protein TatA n=1 Tax=Gordonibacter faecis TaxID=3047475 RepID=A0ABT7DLJ2_9ACTN|nr:MULTISPECIES: twin-arginine translocase TatA/TatE family subunit [unclassified Gordonibacter]MDJ1649428.1 twin-arginine translocase TatA/TatE family subunit [Gordonibacter sp. KGMB12511]HIW75108.1 twin-arginine translocase TatA/TatE family subunit [Candidatus Gordonibacter avicola]